MDRNRKRWILRLAAVLVAGIGAWIYVLWQKEQNRVMIENRSLQPIEKLEMSVEGQDVTLDNVPPTEVVPIPGSGDGTQRLSVKVWLRDGSRGSWIGIPHEGVHLYVLPGGQVDVHRPGQEQKR